MKHSTERAYALLALFLCAFLPAGPSHAQGIDSLDDLDAAFGAPATTGGEPPAQRQTLRISEVRGFLAEELRVYPIDRGGAQNDQQLITEAQIHLDVALARDLSATVVPWFMIDALDTELLRYEPLEAYVLYRKATWSLLAGQFIENWGIVDTFNPLDVLNRRDFATDLLNATVRGELGARARWTLPSGKVIREPTFGVYAIPLWRRTPFPTNEQRFAFVTPGASLDPKLSQGPQGLDDLMWGIRFDHILETEWISADLQYLAVSGPSRTPFIANGVDSDGAAAILPQYYGERVFGGGVRAVPEGAFLSKFTLKAEMAYKLPYEFSHYRNVPAGTFRPYVPQDYFQTVMGLDRVFPSPIFRKDELTVTLEYAFQAGAKDDPASIFRPFNHDANVRLFYSGGDFARTSLELRGIFDVKNGEIIAEGIFSRQLRFIHKDLKLQLMGRYLRPAPDALTLLSLYPTNNSSVSGRLQFDF
jgi:hypothetical protein